MLNTVIDADASVTNDNHAVSCESYESVQGFRKIGFSCADSAAGIFVFNSFVCGAVARGLRSLNDKKVFPTAFSDFFRSFWGQLQVLVEDGVQLPGYISKFVPILDTDDAAVSCSSMWNLAFDGGASAACIVSAAAIARAPFCDRYIQEVI